MPDPGPVSSRRRIPFLAGAAAGGVLLAALPSSLPAQELPPADDLIAAYVEAIGGEEAHAAPTSIRTSGTLSIPSMGLEGEFELLQFPATGSRMRQNLPGLGEMVVGFDGDTGWSMSPITGPSLMGEEELAQMRERSLLAATLRDPGIVPERETLELTEVRGEPCYRVRLEWESGRETYDCYSPETGLLVASEDVQVSEMGEVPVSTFYDDYADFHGMTLPRRLVQETMGVEQILEIEAVVVDDATPEALEPPEAIRTLQEGDPDG